ncbi:MAG: MFS transporter [Pseudomonadota bacterium]|nr:MFS transporter [Pseudomonadota bacterium]
MPILFIIIILSSMGFGLVLPPFIFVAQNFGASPMLATFIISTFAIGQFIATPIWGKLSDKYGRKPILILTMIGSALAYLIMAWADNQSSLVMLLIARFLTGLMSGNFAVATAYVADITPSENRAQGMGMVGGAVSIGFMSGPAIGGLLSGETAETASLFWPSLLAAAMSLITLFAILFFLKESLSAEKRSEVIKDDKNKTNKEGSFVDILFRPVLGLMVLMGFLVFFAAASFESIFPLWADFGFDWGPREVGFCFMYLALIVMITQMFLVGRIAPIFGEGKLLIAALFCYIFGLLFMILVPFSFEPPSWKVMMIGITFTSFGGAMFNTASTSWVSQQASPKERGAVLGLFQSAGWGGRGTGPTFAGYLFQSFGPNSPFIAASLLMLPVLLIVLIIRRRTLAIV